MKQTIQYFEDLAEKGYYRVTWAEMDKCYREKSAYVDQYLSPAVKHSGSGWNGVVYVVYTNGEEYVFFVNFPGYLSRGICVTANSKAAIAAAVFDNID